MSILSRPCSASAEARTLARSDRSICCTLTVPYSGVADVNHQEQLRVTRWEHGIPAAGGSA